MRWVLFRGKSEISIFLSPSRSLTACYRIVMRDKIVISNCKNRSWWTLQMFSGGLHYGFCITIFIKNVLILEILPLWSFMTSRLISLSFISSEMH